MTPEQEAREEIDDQLHQTGWAVQSASEMDISAARGVAVREFPLKTGFADYLLYADAKALGTIEAKPKGHTLTGVETQSSKYSAGLPAGLPHFHLPLPFAYESTGTCPMARLKGEAGFNDIIRDEEDLIRNVHGIARTAGLDGDELGYILAAIAKIKRVE